MADLSQFLNSGGKRYRLAATTKVNIDTNGTNVTITPASDEFAVVRPALRVHTGYATITAGGRDITPDEGAWTDPMPMGLGEAISITTLTESSIVATVFVFEEDV